MPIPYLIDNLPQMKREIIPWFQNIYPQNPNSWNCDIKSILTKLKRLLYRKSVEQTAS